MWDHSQGNTSPGETAQSPHWPGTGWSHSCPGISQSLAQQRWRVGTGTLEGSRAGPQYPLVEITTCKADFRGTVQCSGKTQSWAALIQCELTSHPCLSQHGLCAPKFLSLPALTVGTPARHIWAWLGSPRTLRGSIWGPGVPLGATPLLPMAWPTAC